MHQRAVHLVYELPKDGTDVPKRVAGVKDYVFKCFYLVHSVFFFKMNFNYSNKTVKEDSETL